MGVEIVEELSPVGGAKPSAGNSRIARGQISESITVDTGRGAEPTRDEAAGGVEQETITVGKRRLGLPESARKMLDNIDKHGTVHDESPPAAAVVPDAGVTPVSPAATVADPAAAAAAPVPTPATVDADATERLTEANRKLLAEVETLRSSPVKHTPGQREKTLDEVERLLIDDSIGSLRKLYATALGVEDPKDPAIDQHLTWLYHDLTERELGVPLDPTVKNAREVERVKHLRARDRREMAAESQRAAAPAPSAEDQTFAQHAQLVSGHQTSAGHTAKFPLLMAAGSDIDGRPASELVLREIRRGFDTGEYNRATNDDVLIEAASRRLEAKYQALADKIVKARPAVSTATPTQATVATDQKAEPQGTGHRTITNASASVAPATPPAAKPTPTDDPPKKPWRNEKERIKQLIAKHSGEAIR